MHYVYSLKCKDGYYVGCTDDVLDRLDRHTKGNVLATANRLPVTLEFYFATEDKYKAFEFEKYLKSGSGRAFINKYFTKIYDQQQDIPRIWDPLLNMLTKLNLAGKLPDLSSIFGSRDEPTISSDDQAKGLNLDRSGNQPM